MKSSTKSQIEILFENLNFIVVNKPYGISVHNNEQAEENLIDKLKIQGQWDKLFPVHRLDKETSGLQILAKNSEAAGELAHEFQSHSVKKIYHGICRGQMKLSSGVWKQPLTDKAEGAKNPQGQSKDRVPCETDFKVINQNKYFTLCEFDLKTGRQHQIRKHCALNGHHLVGDTRYGEKKYNQMISSKYQTNRMFLHCSFLKIKGHEFRAPYDFSTLIG